ncbi:hypothetical protein [Mesorhizobium sp. M0030]|uniref:hypothetical protein n=1 Tax=Mesorhizobium sp. M0030 TaxID=2956851 RepID=UPI00333678C4
MFKKKTVLILGAGASYEAGLPVGDMLKTQIADGLRVRKTDEWYGSWAVADKGLVEAIRSLDKSGHYKTGEIQDTCKRISSALPLARSIDNYLHSHKDSKAIEKCGKVGIVGSILNAERESKLKVDDENGASPKVDFPELAGTWYNRFASLMFEPTFDDLRHSLENLTVIIFNYDRCFEHFMYHAIITYYGCYALDAANVVKSMKIYHPYGSAGYLPWMEQKPAAKFGEVVDGGRLLSLADQVKTYTEGVDRESSEIKAIHSAMRETNNVVFLGFGYIPLNMQLLRPPADGAEKHGKTRPEKFFLGTGYGIFPEDREIVSSRVAQMIPSEYGQVTIGDKETTCAGLFDRFGFTVSDL